MRSVASLFIAGLFLLNVSSCHIGNVVGVKGNGTIITEEIEISDYNKISVAYAQSVIYEQRKDAKPYVRIEVDENLYPLLEIKTTNKELKIGVEDNNMNIRPTKFIVYTNSSTLSTVNIAGSTNVHVKGDLNTDNFRVAVAGSGNTVADNIVCESLKIEIAGSGDVTLKGKTANANCEIAGSGNIDISDMASTKAKCQIAGSGNIYVYATEYLKSEIAGSGNIHYKGNPKNDQSVAGSGKIKSMN